MTTLKLLKWYLLTKIFILITVVHLLSKQQRSVGHFTRLQNVYKVRTVVTRFFDIIHQAV